MGCPFFDFRSMSFGMVCMFGGSFRIGTSFVKKPMILANMYDTGRLNWLIRLEVTERHTFTWHSLKWNLTFHFRKNSFEIKKTAD